MKKTLLILAVILLAACATTAKTGEEGRSYSVYEYPDAKEKGTLPEYTIKPNGSIYQKGDPFQRVGEIKPVDKRGE